MNPLSQLAGRVPAPLNTLLAMGGSNLDDLLRLTAGELPANDLDQWDPDYIRATLPTMRAVWGAYHRPEVHGLEKIPDGPCLIVGNHSGGTMIVDTFVFALEFYNHFGPDKRFHQLAHDVAARMPFTGIRRYGVLAASHDNARRAFAEGAPVLVYPGGDHESFRPTTHANRIEFGGRKGWVRLAREEGVPIVPLVSIGGQETAFFLTRGRRAAQKTGWADLTRIKVMPIVLGPPFGVTFMDLPGRLPLPAKLELQVQDPIDLTERYGRDIDDDEVYEDVTAQMQVTLDELAEGRSLPIVG